MNKSQQRISPSINKLAKGVNLFDSWLQKVLEKEAMCFAVELVEKTQMLLTLFNGVVAVEEILPPSESERAVCVCVWWAS